MSLKYLIKDENGKPMKLFHGSEHPTALDQETPTFFSKNHSVANAYAMKYNDDYMDGCIIFSAYISMKKPLVLTREFLEKFAADVLQKGSRNEIEKFSDNFEDSFHEERDIIINYARENSYDGLIIENDSLPVEHMDGDWELQTSYMVFSPSQIHFNIT